MTKELMRLYFLFSLAFALAVLSSCSPDSSDEDAVTVPSEEVEAACLESGDVVVANSGSDSLTVFKADGTFKSIPFYVSSATDNLAGLAWKADTEELLVAVDGVDRVLALSPEDCGNRVFILDPNLTGAFIRDLIQLASGDVLVVEANNVERFGTNGNRVTAGWPMALQTGAMGLGAFSNGNFVHCSNTADVVRTYTTAGVQVSTRASGIAGTTDATDCEVLNDQTVATAWSGTTDTVAIYSADLLTVQATYSNTAYLNTPGGLAERANGNLLIVDRIYNHVVEITNTGTFVGTFGAGYLSTPEYILVIP